MKEEIWKKEVRVASSIISHKLKKSYGYCDSHLNRLAKVYSLGEVNTVSENTYSF